MDDKKLLDLVTEDNEFDNKVYSAITKKFLPEIKLDEPVGLDRIVGGLVLVFLGLIAVMSLADAYRVRTYNKPVIEFKL